MSIFGAAGRAFASGLAMTGLGPNDRIRPLPTVKSVISVLFGKVKLPDYCAKNAPDAFKQLDKDLDFGNPKLPWQSTLGLVTAAGMPAVPDWFAYFWGGEVQQWGILLLKIIRFPFAIADYLQSMFAGRRACPQNKVAGLAIMLGVSGLLERYAGFRVPQYSDPLTYSINYVCPTLPLSPSEALKAYLYNEINEDHCIGYGKMGGVCEETTKTLICTEQYHHSISFCIDIFHRSSTMTEVECKAMLRRVGVVESQTANEIIDNTWNLFSLEQIQRMLIEFRPGRAPQNIVYTDADARRDLRKIGWHTRDHDRLIALANEPIGQRHMQIPYYNDRVTWSDVEANLLDNRWTPQSVALMRQFYDWHKKETLDRLAGVNTPAQIAKMYGEGILSVAEYTAELQKWGFTATVIALAIAERGEERVHDEKRDAIATTKSQYMGGEYTVAEAIMQLETLLVDSSAAAYLVKLWDTELQNRKKPLGVSDLCEMTTRGDIAVSDFVKRLRKMGYSQADADRLVKQCDFKEKQKQQKQAIANQKKADAAAAKAIAAQARQAKAQQAAQQAAIDDSIAEMKAEFTVIQKELNDIEAKGKKQKPEPAAQPQEAPAISRTGPTLAANVGLSGPGTAEGALSSGQDLFPAEE